MIPRQPKQAGSFAARSKRRKLSAGRPDSTGAPNAQRNYERYLALARAEALAWISTAQDSANANFIQGILSTQDFGSLRYLK
jgi:hypothetical protein